MKKQITFLFVSLIGLISINLSAKGHSKNTSLRVATFNIRYENPNDGENTWANRREHICNFIKKENPSIINFQEVLDAPFQYLKSNLAEYQLIGVGRDDGKKKGEYAPVAFKKSEFKLIKSNTFWLAQKPDSVGMLGWDAACVRIATWVKLQDKKTNKIFLVINTHLDHVGVKARKNGALLIMRKIKEIVGDNPAILTGDFNVSEHSQVYKTVTTNKFILKDALKIAQKHSGLTYTFHDFGKIPPKKAERIDFIFVTPQIKVSTIDIPSSKIHNQLYMSDHNPVFTDLSF